jgi:predicted lipoprotein with Yx(FWY)xxD motif
MKIRAGFVAIALAALLALAAAGYGGSSASAMQSAAVVVKTAKVKGKVALVNAAGHTLYMFEKDNRSRVTCTGSCAHYWPPVKQSGAHKATAAGSAKAALIGSDKDPAGGRVVTYSKWPLYTYVGDHGAGTANGEGLNLSGGRWYVLSPTGSPIKSLSSGSGGGGGWG